MPAPEIADKTLRVSTAPDVSKDPAAESRSPGSSPIRWWPALLILSAAVASVIWIRFFEEIQRQDKNIKTAIVGMASLALLLLWCLFFSRLRWRVRWIICGGTVGLLGLIASLFQIHGVSGDLIPILRWRWAKAKTSAASLRAPVETAQSNQAPSALDARADYPQFLGPRRNATVDGPTLVRDWKTSPPVLLWRQPVNPAWSGFAIAANYAITQEQRGEEELVVCYDLLSGRLLWSHADQTRYFTGLGGEGPRATPTIAAQRVFALGATGRLNCLELASGKLIWSKNIIEENHSHLPDWGLSGSPLVTDDWVIVSAGGKHGRSLVAYDRVDGRFVWGGGEGRAGYSSPFLTSIAGTPQILIFNADGLAAHAAADGKVLWKHPWPGGHPHVAMPLVLPDDRVLISTGYGDGSELLQIQRDAAGEWTASRVWKSLKLKAKFTNPVYRGGYVYGLDDGILVCLDIASGNLAWKQGRYGHGQVILVGGLLLVTTETGEVILLEPTPLEHRELSRFRAFHGKTWNPPALAGEFLLLRNDSEAACYRLPVVKNGMPRPID